MKLQTDFSAIYLTEKMIFFRDNFIKYPRYILYSLIDFPKLFSSIKVPNE